MKLGFIGLGQMGKYCALNLLKNRGELHVNDIDPEAVAFLISHSAKKSDSNAELMSVCDIVFLCLPNGDIVEKVIFGEHGLAEGFEKGKIIVDLTTADYQKTRETALRVEALGVNFIDAPLSGMEARAKTGQLSVMCGGKKNVFDVVSTYLDDIGSSVLFLGEYGSGQLAKMINNVLYNINMAALAEILPFAVKMGLAPEKVGTLVNAGTGRSYASEYFIPKILERDFVYGFTMDSAYKDMQSASVISAKMKIPTPVLHAAMTTYQMTLLEGWGQEYKGAMIKVYEKLLGVKFSKNVEMIS